MTAATALREPRSGAGRRRQLDRAEAPGQAPGGDPLAPSRARYAGGQFADATKTAPSPALEHDCAPRCRRMTAGDIATLFRAYEQGALAGVLPEGITAENFWRTFKTALDRVRPGANIGVLLVTLPALGEVPAAWLFGWRYALGSTGTELHAVWAPWAPEAARIAAAAAFLRVSREHPADGPAMWCCRRDEAPLFDALCARGVARKVGDVEDLFGPGADGAIYQGRRRR